MLYEKWDANRRSLMYEILLQQADQCREFAALIVKHGEDDLIEDSMVDSFWPTSRSPTSTARLPGIWADLAAHIKTSGRFPTTTTKSTRRTIPFRRLPLSGARSGASTNRRG